MVCEFSEFLPTIRWNIGDVHRDGILCLNSAIETSRIFDGIFNRVVVSNTIDFRSYIDVLKSTWDDRLDEIPNISKMFWKWCGPRFNNHCNEMVLDNDVVLIKDSIQIRNVMNMDCPSIGIGWRHLYGSVGSSVIIDRPACAGIVVLPPKYDIIDKLLRNWRSLGRPNMSNPLDEQGLVVYTLLQDNVHIFDCGVIPNLVYDRNTMSEICDYKISGDECGYHFVGANRGTNTFLNDYLQNVRDFR